MPKSLGAELIVTAHGFTVEFQLIGWLTDKPMVLKKYARAESCVICLALNTTRVLNRLHLLLNATTAFTLPRCAAAQHFQAPTELAKITRQLAQATATPQGVVGLHLSLVAAHVVCLRGLQPVLLVIQVNGAAHCHSRDLPRLALGVAKVK